MKEFFKFAWVPAVFVCGVFSLVGYMSWRECKIQNDLTDRALTGNHYAIEILRQYEKPWKLDQKVVDEALNGNPCALQILKINAIHPLPNDRL